MPTSERHFTYQVEDLSDLESLNNLPRCHRYVCHFPDALATRTRLTVQFAPDEIHPVTAGMA